MADTTDYEIAPVELVPPTRQLVPIAIEFAKPLEVLDVKADPRVYQCNINIVSKAYDNGKEAAGVALVRTVVDVANPGALIVSDQGGQPIAADLEGKDADLAAAIASLRAAVDYIARRTLLAGPAVIANSVAQKLPAQLGR